MLLAVGIQAQEGSGDRTGDPSARGMGKTMGGSMGSGMGSGSKGSKIGSAMGSGNGNLPPPGGEGGKVRCSFSLSTGTQESMVHLIMAN